MYTKSSMEWYAIRDALLGGNRTKRDVKRALLLASTCAHPDARWLSAAFAGKDVNTPEEAKDVFVSLGDDARALCFAATVLFPLDEALLRQSAYLGYAFAQAKLAQHLGFSNEECFNWAERAALQGERDGFAWLGVYLQHGTGCERNVDKAKENFLRASNLNDVNCMIFLGSLLQDSDPERWKWLGRAASRGDPFKSFLRSFSRVVLSHKREPSLARAVFAIGRALFGHVNSQEREIFCAGEDFDSYIGAANSAVNFFVAQCQAARKAVDTWTLIARRIGNLMFNKDIRKKVNELIWEARELAHYHIGSYD